MAEDDWRSVVIDNGSGICKAGFAGDDAPKAVFPMVVASPKDTLYDLNLDPTHTYVAEEAMSKRGIMALRHPVERGLVKSAEDMSTLWWHTYRNALQIDPSDWPVLITETPMNPKYNREKMAEIMFEDLQVPSLYVATQGALSLFASGRTSGLVLNSGEGVTSVTPIYEGHMISTAVSKVDLAGKDVTKYMCKLLEKMGHAFRTSGEIQLVRDMKEKLCCVALDYQQIKDSASIDPEYLTYELPDGQIIKFGKERYQAAELIFNPTLNDLETPGLTKMLWGAIQECELDVRKTMCSNILLSGGNTMFEGLKERIDKDILARAPPGVDVNVLAPADRKYSTWIGGSLLASLTTFQNQWVTKKEYDESGVAVLHKKCT